MTHASLFSGIGGFDLAAEWAGWTNAFNCEIDSFCRKILKYHFPDAEQYGDIRTTDFAVWRDRIDVLTGGFPCQPFSLAGKRKGTEDDRYLWPEMLRVIRTVRPRWVVGENVFGIVNWSEGMVLDTVCSDLEAAGYTVQPYIIPACGVGAPHRRDRCWFVAHRTDARVETMREGQDGFHVVGVAADADCDRRRIGGINRILSPEAAERPTLALSAKMGLLPTPTVNDATNSSLPASQVKRKSGLPRMAMQSDEYRTGTTSRLNPLYVIEMMGFPANWLVSPFLRGVGNPSKHAARHSTAGGLADIRNDK